MSSVRSELIKLAKAVSKNAYAPYSNFAVGCALQSGKGEFYTGTNVENLSFGLTICAERAAILKAISEEGSAFRIKEIVVYTSTESPITPCGACLQVLQEFGSNFNIFSICNGKDQLNHTIEELFPRPPDILL